MIFLDSSSSRRRLRKRPYTSFKASVGKLVNEKFAAKYNLAFPLASDEDHKVAEAYGVWVEKSMYGKKYMGMERSSFLVDADGRIARIWRKVKPAEHAAQVLEAAAAL